MGQELRTLMSEQDKFGAALHALRDMLRRPGLRAGSALAVEPLAKRLRISATPIREALAYLAGAGLVDEGARGYRVRRMDPADVTALYRLHRALVDLALDAPPTPRAPGPDAEVSAGAYLDRVEALWARLVGTDAAPQLRAALRRVSDALAPARWVEPQVFADCEAELARLERLCSAPDRASLGAAVSDYHARRTEACQQISAEVHWSSSRSQI